MEEPTGDGQISQEQDVLHGVVESTVEHQSSEPEKAAKGATGHTRQAGRRVHWFSPISAPPGNVRRSRIQYLHSKLI
jgi:hypothetical protein